MSKKKKMVIIFSVIIVVLIISGVVFFLINRNTTNTTNAEIVNAEVSKLKELPKPEITGGTRGELGIDKNINEATIDEYLNREDSVYRDMRMLEDPGDYEKIGGDRFLSGYIEGFAVIPLPYIIPVTGLPTEVGDTYTGTTLFYDDNGTYVANYEESMDIIKEIFPKDKVIFLMCGGGGYAGMTKDFLVALGWDENKIYNTGGYWYYKGEHSINVKKEVNGVVSYDFDSVPYHNIEFDKLTKSANYKAPTIKVTELKINTTKIELEEGTSFKLNAIILPNEATNKEVKWTSSNEAVATVTDEGLVKAIGSGNATIIVESIDSKETVSCEVTVNKKVSIIKVTGLKINTTKIELEEGTSFKLNAIVLPNEATNKEVKWTSSNEAVATVTDEGLVKAIKSGNTTITVESIDSKKTVSCEVTVNKKEVSTRIKINDISKEAKEFNLNDPLKLNTEFHVKTELKTDSDGNYIPNKYHEYNGEGYAVNDLWREEYRKYQEKLDQVTSDRAKILDKLIDNKKSFVILFHTKECDAGAYSVIEGAEKILKQNNISYLYTHSPTAAPDETLEKSKIDVNKFKGGSIVIVKNGDVYASIDREVDAIKNDEETKNWLSKYIDIK